MQDKNNLETSLNNLLHQNDSLREEKESLRKAKSYAEVLEKLKQVNYNTYSSVFDKSGGLESANMYFAHKGVLKAFASERLQNFQAINFCYKCGVKLVIEEGLEPRVARGGGDDLYGICVDYDDLTKTATVISIASSFECIVLSHNDVKSGDRLVVDESGLFKSINSKSSYMHAVALSSACEFKDKPGYYGTKVMLLSKTIASAS
ncbi:hypothetical protein CR532_04650 (plasmid) [Candidatus Borreliella tachyglossi]|uniref:Uncharacterized protein n=1 Tax=Candidatus Borreliella tachyglossi TaxID=1964448 RepID=A0A2S1LYF1_9SPIR|nr:DUF228 domain-containing protein [Candidatus Borreliella tachyglossi]AWG43290.1 hypothetical protein CR532_04650 [Candidatus Borreliella tachyglossi]